MNWNQTRRAQSATNTLVTVVTGVQHGVVISEAIVPQFDNVLRLVELLAMVLSSMALFAAVAFWLGMKYGEHRSPQ